MSKNSRIALYVLIAIAFLALLLYGVLSTKKLDKLEEKTVVSNIDGYIYDETKDSIQEALEEELEDLDGEEVTDEDDDFEVYEEDDGWDDEEEEEVSPDESEPIANDLREEKLEELYDNKVKKEEPEPDAEIEPAKKEVKENTQAEGNYLVVIGSFKSKRNANKKLKKLKEANVEGSIIQLKGSKLQTAIAGRFENRRDAQKLADKLENEFDLRAIVKKLE